MKKKILESIKKLFMVGLILFSFIVYQSESKADEPIPYPCLSVDCYGGPDICDLVVTLGTGGLQFNICYQYPYIPAR